MEQELQTIRAGRILTAVRMCVFMKQMRKTRLVAVLMGILGAAVIAFLLIGPTEKYILSNLLPGEWTLWAGGGYDGFHFRPDGTVTVLRHDSDTLETVWQLNSATAAEQLNFWSHPRILLQIGNQSYGISLGLEGLAVHGGKRISDTPWSFSITFSEGGGEYIRLSQ